MLVDWMRYTKKHKQNISQKSCVLSFSKGNTSPFTMSVKQTFIQLKNDVNLHRQKPTFDYDDWLNSVLCRIGNVSAL